MKRSLLALVVLFGAVLVLVATSTSPASAKFAAQAATPDASVTASIRVSTWESGPNLQYWTNAISGFNQLYPNITVQLEAVPNNYGTNLLAQIAAGNAPDVFQNGDGDVSTYVAKGAVADLSPYITGKNGVDTSLFFPDILKFGQVNGTQYYLTKDYSPLILFYNPDLLKKAGLEAPKAGYTWDDLLKMAQKLTLDANGNDATSPNFDAKKIKQWGLGIPAGWGDWLWDRGIEPLLFQFGGGLVSGDGKTTTGIMNSDATVAALQWYSDLFNKYHVSPTKDDFATFSGADLFQGGQVAMLWNGVWAADSYTQVKGFNFGIAELPTGPKGAANVLCWAGFALNPKSANKDAAWLFLKYITAGDGAKQFANYALPSVKTLADEIKAKAPYKAAVFASLAHLQSLPDFTTVKYNDCVAKFFKQELETALKGSATVKAAMDKAAAEADACLAAK
jgi:multiple sugar transport system substrate-binding protein